MLAPGRVGKLTRSYPVAQVPEFDKVMSTMGTSNQLSTRSEYSTDAAQQENPKRAQINYTNHGVLLGRACGHTFDHGFGSSGVETGGRK